ncbi:MULTISPECIES: acyl-CoA thioesterase [unclassified Gilliamella]|uniref:acyl-CoA thioesterase n=1 Tax=unclassified Gilliamella TaxID=2685620 RepID=UPI00080DD94F|nr:MULTISPECIES: thioesterase family protein [Gilliamella]MCX8573709.1 acyl-CoA thioesterase [Gilliamella sp. B3831]MCX8575663.1 acyl-CoA thioesterase [Gilliamella sp. B3815]MCX8586959.1 acyl-CoA thioesterase [Gilliamella sp. B3801]MCX8589864.1 acyl-CoA thioesterase [Gilliamella sp. B3812]MCX8592509.1 acyl-CoA thioesterase [Gilliamella sp. B3804]
MKNDLKHSVTIEYTTSFHDTDAMGVVWHGNYLKFFEKAREALFQKFNYGYQEMIDSGYLWPIVDTRIKYISPTIAEQTLKIVATLVEYEHRIKINYLILDAKTEKKMTSGYTIQVAVSASTQEMSFITPQIFLNQFGL